MCVCVCGVDNVATWCQWCDECGHAGLTPVALVMSSLLRRRTWCGRSYCR